MRSYAAKNLEISYEPLFPPIPQLPSSPSYSPSSSFSKTLPSLKDSPSQIYHHASFHEASRPFIKQESNPHTPIKSENSKLPPQVSPFQPPGERKRKISNIGSEGPYGLILMDTLMPVMDGFSGWSSTSNVVLFKSRQT